MASTVYTAGALRLLTGLASWENGTFKAMLLNTSYTPDPDHTTVSDLVANELADAVSLTGYEGGFGGAGRLTLTTVAPAVDDANNQIEFDASDLLWASIASGATAKGAAIIQEVTDDASSPIYAFVEFTAAKATGDGGGGAAPFPLNWGSEGVFKVTMS